MHTLALLMLVVAQVVADPLPWWLEPLKQSPIAVAIIVVMMLFMKRMDKQDDKHADDRKAQATLCHEHQTNMINQCAAAIEQGGKAIEQGSQALLQNSAALGHSDAMLAQTTAVMARMQK